VTQIKVVLTLIKACTQAPKRVRRPSEAIRGAAIRGAAIRGAAIRGAAIRGAAIRGAAIREVSLHRRIDGVSRKALLGLASISGVKFHQGSSWNRMQ